MSTGKTSPDRSSCSGWKKNYSEPKCYWKLIILNGIFVSRTWFENNKSVRCQLIQLTFSNALKPVHKRIWTSDPSLRRAPTYCHSLSIWGKVNPSGTLYKTVSDSIRVILNTPLSSSVKLWKLADCLLQLIIGECLDITIDICYMTTMLRTFDHGKQYSIKLSYRKYKIFSCL